MIFHLAIPAVNIDASLEFYQKLGATVGRRYKNSAVMNFFGHQVVLHKYNRTPTKLKMYPRHFGIILEMPELERMWETWKDTDSVFKALFSRHNDDFAEHKTFFLKDPSKNLIEFKSYKQYRAVFE